MKNKKVTYVSIGKPIKFNKFNKFEAPIGMLR
mgnify:CR=1 FL=1